MNDIRNSLPCILSMRKSNNTQNKLLEIMETNRKICIIDNKNYTHKIDQYTLIRTHFEYSLLCEKFRNVLNTIVY